MTLGAATGPSDGVLPRWSSVLAVVAHPDDESFGLGAVLDAFARAGSRVTVPCLTHGEASTVHGTEGDLAVVRAQELQAAAAVLGVTATVLLDHPDGELASMPAEILTAEVVRAARDAQADGVVAFDPAGVTGHPDHVAATAAAAEAASALDLPLLVWTVPRRVAEQLNEELATSFVGHDVGEGDLVVPVDRQRQVRASRQHVSQAIPTSVLWRRLDLLGDTELLRWVRRGGAG